MFSAASGGTRSIERIACDTYPGRLCRPATRNPFDGLLLDVAVRVYEWEPSSSHVTGTVRGSRALYLPETTYSLGYIDIKV